MLRRTSAYLARQAVAREDVCIANPATDSRGPGPRGRSDCGGAAWDRR